MTPDTTVLVAADGARAVVHAQGAQVLSWIPAEGGERLFLGARAVLDGSLPIRGGVPLIFPQFAGEGPLPKHGFARMRRWQCESNAVDAEGRAVARFALADDAATRALWPQSFLAELEVVVIGASLGLRLAVENRGESGFAFTAALHSYLAVDDIAGAELPGLQHLRYRDTAGGGREHVERAEVLRFDGEVDRIYFDAPTALSLRHGGGLLLSQTTGFADVVIWNPGAARAAGFADLALDEWRRFVCVEPAVIGVPQRLPPGQRWEGSQTLTVRPRALATRDR